MVCVYLRQKDQDEDLFKEGSQAFIELSHDLLDWEWPDKEIEGWNGYFDSVEARMIDNDFSETPTLLDCLKGFGIDAVFYNFSGECFDERYSVNGVLHNGVYIDFDRTEYFMQEDENKEYENAGQEEILEGFKNACKNAVPETYHERIDEFFNDEEYENYEVFCDDEFDIYAAKDAIHGMLKDYILPGIEPESSRYMPEFELDLERFDIYDEEW